MERITTKRIDEQTPIIPDIIAESIAETLLEVRLKDWLSLWNDMNEEQRDGFNQLYKREKREIEEYLVERANTTYQYDRDFNKLMKSKSNAGRDSLYMYMYHWIGFDRNERKILAQYPDIIAKYRREKEMFEHNGNG